MSEANKAVIRRFMEEIWNRGDLSVIDTLVAPDYVHHRRTSADYKGRAGLQEHYRTFHESFPDGRFTITELVAEGDKVAMAWRFKGTHKAPFAGIAATGKSVEWTGTTMFRLAAGRVAEMSLHWDLLTFLQQIGKAPA